MHQGLSNSGAPSHGMAVERKDLQVSTTIVGLSALRKRQDVGVSSGDEYQIRQREYVRDGVRPAVQSTGRSTFQKLAEHVAEAKLPSSRVHLADGVAIISRRESHEDFGRVLGWSVNHPPRLPDSGRMRTSFKPLGGEHPAVYPASIPGWTTATLLGILVLSLNAVGTSVVLFAVFSHSRGSLDGRLGGEV